MLFSVKPYLPIVFILASLWTINAYADEGETDVSPADIAEEDYEKDGELVEDPEELQSEQAPQVEENPDSTPAAEADGGTDPETSELTEADSEQSGPPKPFVMLGGEVPAGETRRLSWVASESFSGISVPTPVLVSHGVKPGPILCLTAAVHGDELNGIEMVRRVLYGLEPDKLTGTVVGVPIVNLFGFRRSSRYLPDRRDLNRYFPGDARGSSASRIAHAFFESVIKKCDYLVDLHTGSFHRTNLPQLRADLSDPEILKLTQGFGATAVLRSKGQIGTLRRAAAQAGIPAVTLEAGEPTRFQPEEVAHGVKGIRTLLNKLGMLTRVSLWGDPQPVYYASEWVRADTGGILFSRVSLGDEVEKNQILGTVTDPINNNRSEIRAPVAGRILGMALNQVVIPGFASFRIGTEKSSDEVVLEAVSSEKTDEPGEESSSSSKNKAEAGNTSENEDLVDEEIATKPPPKAAKDGVDEERPD